MKSRLVSVLIVICLFLSFALQLPLLAYAEEGKDLTMPYELSGGYEWEYIGQHMDYYTNSFSDDIVPMKEKIGLGMLLEDSQSDLSDTLYGLLDNAIKAVDLTGIVDAFTNGHKYPINFTNEYSLVIFQLMTNDLTTNGLQDAYCGLLQDSVVDVTSTVAEKLTDLFDSNATDADIISQMTSAMDTLKDADPNSNEFMHAWEQFAGLCSQYIDFNQMTTFCDNLLADLGDAASILGSSIDELKTIGDAYRYICFARSYLELSDAFKTALDKLASMAYDKAWYSSPSKRFDTDPYADENQYYNLYSAITAWTEKADEYQKDALAEFAKDVSEGTLGTSVDLLADAAIDVILPGFGQIKAALSLGKLGIDLFTTVDDEYKQSLMVSCLDHITTLMIEVAEYYVPMIGTIDRDKTGDGTGGEAWIKMTPYDQAVMFDESINIYKSAMKLACEYGTAYEQSKLNFATAIANGTASFDSFFATCLFYSEYWGNTTWWQEQASLSSSIVEALAVQKLELDKIQCHDEALLLKQEQEAAPGPSEKPTADKVLLAVNLYDENGELDSTTRYEYGDMLPIRSVSQAYGSFSNKTVFDYTYDEQGHLLNKHRRDENPEYDYDIFVRSYDSEGKLLSESYNGIADMLTEVEYTYGQEDRVAGAIRKESYPSTPMPPIVNEFSYSYYEDSQGNLVAVRHCENNSALKDAEFIYDAEGRMLQGYDEYWEVPTRYEYIDDPYFCIRDELTTIDFGDGPIEDYWRTAYILDSAGKEIEAFELGNPESVQMTYDENGYLVSVDNSEKNMYYTRCEFIYGAPGEEPEAPSPTPEKETLPPLAYENRTEHHELVTTGGVLVGTSELAFPYFTDGSQMAGTLNESIGAILDQRRNAQMDPEDEEYFGEMVAQGAPPSADDVEITVTYNENGLLSLLHRYTFYNPGGAHAYTSYEGYIYDTSTCGQLGVRDLAGSRYSQMCDRLSQEASKQGVSRGTPERAEACVLSEAGGSFYFNVGEAVPREIVTVPFTSDYFDRAPANSGTGENVESVGGSAAGSENESALQAQGSRVTLTVTGNGVNIRSGPGTGYESIGSVSTGDKLFSTDKSDNWYLVEYGGGTGYIIEDYVTTASGGIYTAADSGTLSVNGIDVNIRSGPGTEYQSIGKVSRGTTLTITGKSDNWYQVSYNGGTGYIIADYVIKNG